MAPNPFERLFKKNLDDNEVFDKTVSGEILKIVDRVGVNMPGLHMAYQKAQELNKQRKSPQHKHYLLNMVRDTALSSSRFFNDLMLDPQLQRSVDNEIARMREKD